MYNMYIYIILHYNNLQHTCSYVCSDNYAGAQFVASAPYPPSNCLQGPLWMGSQNRFTVLQRMAQAFWEERSLQFLHEGGKAHWFGETQWTMGQPRFLHKSEVSSNSLGLSETRVLYPSMISHDLPIIKNATHPVAKPPCSSIISFF